MLKVTRAFRIMHKLATFLLCTLPQMNRPFREILQSSLCLAVHVAHAGISNHGLLCLAVYLPFRLDKVLFKHVLMLWQKLAIIVAGGK